MKWKEKISLAILILLILTRLIFLNYTARKSNRKVNDERLEKLREIQRPTEEEKSLVKEEFLDDANDLIAKVKYDYNKQGDLSNVKYINEAEEIIEKKEYQYNNDELKEKKIIDTTASNWQDYSWRFSSKDMTEFRSQRKVQDFTSRRSSSNANYEYNKVGQLINYEKTDEDGTIVRKIEIKYHDNSEKKEVVEAKGSDYLTTAKYNQHGQLKEKIIEDGFFTELREYKYDGHENEIKETMKRKNNQDKLISKRVSESTYNQQGKKLNDTTSSKTYINDDVIERYFAYQYNYDNDGNKIETIALTEEGERLKKINYEYDKLGNKIMEKRKKDDGRTTYHFEKEYKADTEANKIIIKKVDLLNDKVIEDKYQYDEFGNLIRVKVRNKKGEIEKNKRYTYK